METNNFNYVQSQEGSTSASRTFLANVFSWMTAALVITSVVAYYFSHSPELISTLYALKPNGGLGMTGLGILVSFLPLIFILVMNFGINRISYPVLLVLFLLFSAVMGMSLSTIFFIYTGPSIINAFASASAVFGLMAFVGYTTKTDLTKFGAIMTIGLIAIVVVSLVNMFLRNDTIDYVVSFIGVLVFTGLTAYDVQKLKNIGSGVQFGLESTGKLVIMGALNLYLDFINLFLFLLRLFGDRK